MARCQVTSLKKLHDEMRAGVLPARFVRCLKPCRRLAPGAYAQGYVAHQLRGCRAAEDVAMQQNGYPVRLQRKAFWNDFHVLDPASRVDDAEGLVASITALVPELQKGYERRTGKRLGTKAERAIVAGRYRGSAQVLACTPGE